MMKTKIIGLIMIVLLGFCACGKKDLSQGEIEGYKYKETDKVTNYVKIVTNKNKVILIELYPDIAPLTVENFQKLVKEKFYDGIIFHRVIADFMIQGGDPTGTGYEGSKETIKGEFANNGVENTLKHEEGVVSMARSNGDMDSASSQFFICVNSNDKIGYLDGDYAAFGKVIAGYQNVVEISKVKTDIYDKPTTVQKMETVRFVEVSK